MSTFKAANLALISQGVSGHRVWDYTDTGVLADITEVDGYFSGAGDLGMEKGDFIYIHATNGGLTAAVHGTTLQALQDTGASQGTSGISTMIGDTS